MISRIEVVVEGGYLDAFKEGLTWLSNDDDYKKVKIEVKPHDKSNLKTVVVMYEHKENNHE